MKRYLIIAGIALSATLLFSGCAQNSSSRSAPALEGNTTFAGPTPPPIRTQQNAAIDASTMIAPTR